MKRKNTVGKANVCEVNEDTTRKRKVFGESNRDLQVELLRYEDEILKGKRTINRYDETENTQKIIEKNGVSDPRMNILKIKQSIAEILNESVKSKLELRRLRERLESAGSSRGSQENTRREILDIDVSSIKSSTKEEVDLNERILDIKSQLENMKKRLATGEKAITVRSIENIGLKSVISTLHDQVERIKQHQQEKIIQNSMCSRCSIC